MIVLSARGRGGVKELRFLPGGELLARTGNGFCSWDLDARALRLDEPMGYAFYRLWLAPDQRTLVGSGPRGVGVYLLTKGRWVGEPLQSWYPSCALWSPDGGTLMLGKSLVWPGEQPECFYRTSDWQPAAPFLTRRPAGTSPYNGVPYHDHAALTPDGRLAVTYSRGTLHLYDLPANEFMREVTLPVRNPEPGLFTPDGSRFLIWAAFKIYALDLDQGKVAFDYPACPRAVHAATLTPDGRHLLQVSADKTVRVLDIVTGVLVKDFAWNVGKLDAVAVSPDGLLAACGGSSGKVVVWDMDL